MFEFQQERMFPEARKWMPPLAGLLPAALTTLQLRPIPSGRPIEGSELLRIAASYTAIPVLVCFVLFMVAAGLLRVWQWKWTWLAAVRWSACAAWMGPLAVLILRRPGPAALVAAAFLISLARQTQWHWQAIRPAAEPEPPAAAAPFSLIEAHGWHARFAGALLTAAAAQGALVAQLVGRIPAALVLGSCAAGVIAWRIAGIRNRTGGWWLASRRACLAASSAFVIVCLLLVPLLRKTPGGSGDRIAAWFRRLRPVAAAATAGEAARGGRYSPLGDDYPGIIVRPVPEGHTVLVAPPPVLARGVSAIPRASARSIPFYGVYWFFRFPQRRPPANSITLVADPATRGFFTVDSTLLNQEARQNLGVEVELAGCREIVVWLRNQEAQPVTVQLILVNTQGPDRVPLSLGMEEAPPHATGVRFSVPRHPRIRRFDEFRVVFHRTFRRRARSAKIAIDRFELRN